MLNNYEKIYFKFTCVDTIMPGQLIRSGESLTTFLQWATIWTFIECNFTGTNWTIDRRNCVSMHQNMTGIKAYRIASMICQRLISCLHPTLFNNLRSAGK